MLFRSCHMEEIEFEKFDKYAIESFIKNGGKSQVKAFVSNYLKALGSSMDSLFFRQYIVMDVYFTVAAFCDQQGYHIKDASEVLGDTKAIAQVACTREATGSYLIELLENTLVLRDTVSKRRYTTMIEEAKDYMHKNYSNDIISLNVVAEHVNMSASHFSMVFAQEVGQTFISYLTEIRMNKAKELLLCSSLKTLEIGYEVGYKDPHYFSHLFKKTQNCTPKEYRRVHTG